MSQRNPISCLFFYKKRLMTKDAATGHFKPALNKDGSVKTNANYINFLQVISCYWEMIDENSEKMQLNVFLNGGSVSRDRESGAAQMKSGYTLVLPAFLGEAFIDQFYTWSCSFGLAAPAPPVYTNQRNEDNSARSARPRTNGTAHSSRAVREDEFEPLDESETAPYLEADLG